MENRCKDPDWIQLVHSTGSTGTDKEYLGSIKDGEFPDYLRDNCSLKDHSALWNESVNLIGGYQHFVQSCSLHLQGRCHPKDEAADFPVALIIITVWAGC
jgi:hypothetical protein